MNTLRSRFEETLIDKLALAPKYEHDRFLVKDVVDQLLTAVREEMEKVIEEDEIHPRLRNPYNFDIRNQLRSEIRTRLKQVTQ